MIVVVVRGAKRKALASHDRWPVFGVAMAGLDSAAEAPLDR